MTKKQGIRGFIYLSGMMITALGINVLLRGELGAGAWDTTIYNFSQLATITLGTASFIVYISILTFVILYNKKLKYVAILIPIIGISLANDFWDIIVFATFYPSMLWLRFLFFVGGAIILTMGLSLMIVTKYPAMVFDELTLSFMRLFKIDSFFKSRIIIELIAIVLAIGFGFMASIGFGAVSYGSLFLAFMVGPMIEVQLHLLKRLFKPILV